MNEVKESLATHNHVLEGRECVRRKINGCVVGAELGFWNEFYRTAGSPVFALADEIEEEIQLISLKLPQLRQLVTFWHMHEISFIRKCFKFPDIFIEFSKNRML